MVIQRTIVLVPCDLTKRNGGHSISVLMRLLTCTDATEFVHRYLNSCILHRLLIV